MNEKYLWDKTGEDAEIEFLEKTLQTFRSFRTHAPGLPAKIIRFAPPAAPTFSANKPRRVLSFAFAAAACLAAAFFVFAALSGSFYSIPPIAAVAAKQPNAPQILNGEIKTVNNAPPVKKRDDKYQYSAVSINKKAASPKHFIERNAVKTKYIAPAANLNKEFAARRTAPDKNLNLTGEEKFAYNQLMLALSITSSKLKIVKDKAENDGKND